MGNSHNFGMMFGSDHLLSGSFSQTYLLYVMGKMLLLLNVLQPTGKLASGGCLGKMK
jgi:hypothetical protein